MIENEYKELIFLLLLLAGVWFGQYQTNKLWSGKAKCTTRKECYGKLYWIIEDEDIDKLKHVELCFDHKKKINKRL